MASIKNTRFKEHYDKLVQPIYRYLYYKCGDTEQARDLLQDVFAKYWEKMDTVIEGGESAYLYQMARNMLINKSQKIKVALKFKQSLRTNTDHYEPHFLLEEKEFKMRLEQAISNLSEGQREVLLMHRMDGLKYKEIAEMLNISQKAVEKRMHQALTKLRLIHKNI